MSDLRRGVVGMVIDTAAGRRKFESSVYGPPQQLRQWRGIPGYLSGYLAPAGSARR